MPVICHGSQEETLSHYTLTKKNKKIKTRSGQHNQRKRWLFSPQRCQLPSWGQWQKRTRCPQRTSGWEKGSGGCAGENPSKWEWSSPSFPEKCNIDQEKYHKKNNLELEAICQARGNKFSHQSFIFHNPFLWKREIFLWSQFIIGFPHFKNEWIFYLFYIYRVDRTTTLLTSTSEWSSIHLLFAWY